MARIEEESSFKIITKSPFMSYFILNKGGSKLITRVYRYISVDVRERSTWEIYKRVYEKQRPVGRFGKSLPIHPKGKAITIYTS